MVQEEQAVQVQEKLVVEVTLQHFQLSHQQVVAVVLEEMLTEQVHKMANQEAQEAVQVIAQEQVIQHQVVQEILHQFHHLKVIEAETVVTHKVVEQEAAEADIKTQAQIVLQEQQVVGKAVKEQH